MNVIQNVNNSGGLINQTTNYVTNNIQLYGLFHELYKKVKVGVKQTLGKTISVTDISNLFFINQLQYGTLIKTRGFLSRYSLNYKPNTFVPNYTNPANIVQVSGRGSKKSLPNKTFSAVGQIPVQALPPVISNAGEEFLICFIYPEKFKSFILPPDPQKQQASNSQDYLLIDDKIKGIPVLMQKLKAEKYLESTVDLVGSIGTLDSAILAQINTSLDSTIQEIFNSFYRPLSTTPEGVCVDCRDSNYHSISVVKKIDSLPAAIYVEGHFDNIGSDLMLEIAKDAYSFTSKSFVQFSVTSTTTTTFAAHDNIIFKTAKPGTVGFYTETDLVNNQLIEQDLKVLKDKYEKFLEMSKKIGRNKYQKSVILKPDFLFDYRRAKLFYHKGILKSKDLTSISGSNPKLNKTIKWFNRD